MEKHLRSSGWWLISALILAVSAPASAQLEVSWSSVDGGGGASSGGSFEVVGTTGQPDGGTISGATLDLEGGFWTSENPAVPVELMSFEVALFPSSPDLRPLPSGPSGRRSQMADGSCVGSPTTTLGGILSWPSFHCQVASDIGVSKACSKPATMPSSSPCR